MSNFYAWFSVELDKNIEVMRYEFWIDRGGTFTDCIMLDRESGARRVTKVLSSDEAPIRGVRHLLDLDEAAPIPPSDIRMGTTVATNALLERQGAKTALVITEGFRDLLRIGDQTRPELFELNIQREAPLYAAAHEINARLDSNGGVLAEPSDEEMNALATKISSQEVESVALVVLHAYANPAFEKRLAERLETSLRAQQCDATITASIDSTAEQGLLGRAGTTVLDAYITPLLSQYLEKLSRGLEGSMLRLMQSSGGLASPHRFRGPQAILSGPAGGLVAASRIAKQIGAERIVTFDMGGTSTDVSLIENSPTLRYEKKIGGVELRATMLDIHTIAAGGGSECTYNGYSIAVGPQSVGADPGPICYGKQTGSDTPRLALTDINLVLGRIAADHFAFPLCRQEATDALSTMARRIGARTAQEITEEELARGFAAVGTANMAEAIRTVTVKRGLELSSVALLVFGGAAGQHACAIASSLGIQRILVHRLSGVLSAFGIGQADEVWSGESDSGRITLDQPNERALVRLFVALEEKGRLGLSSELERNAQGRNSPIQVTRSLALRYRGTESALTIPWASLGTVRRRFEEEHLRRYGFHREEAEVEVVTSRVEIRILAEPETATQRPSIAKGDMPQPIRTTRVVLDRRTDDSVPVYELEHLEGAPYPLIGPALLLDPTGTYLIEEDYQAQLNGDVLTITPSRGAQRASRSLTFELNQAARSQILATRFSAIAEQMGEALRLSASSTNIRDRLDYSCAVFDREGRLVANAPHIPVHLGAMSESVTAIRRLHLKMAPGDSFVTNDPNLGGSHLPDVTVVTPLFDDENELIAFTASRGHHADIGGIEPGSMPAFSKRLQEEGIVLSGIKVVERGRLLDRTLLKLLESGPHPARRPEENLADLKAQLAANQLGVQLLGRLRRELGAGNLLFAMDAVRQLSAEWMRDAIQELPDRAMTFSDALDDGSTIKVTLTKENDNLHIDFSGSSSESEGNFNAPRAVTLACVLYVLRVLLGKPLPLNHGCLDPVQLTIPKNSILHPSPERAVAAGNVETSQRIVDVLLGALDLTAASQGTMNNLSLGNEDFGYYETIAGGAGAGAHFDGASAVHTHMTNTRITDPEVLEDRFPVRLIRFAIRDGSGGKGKRNGGDGVVREIKALTNLRLSLISERRSEKPFGLKGGAPGAAGRNAIDGDAVPARYSGTLRAGQTVRVETPGGGGYGGV